MFISKVLAFKWGTWIDYHQAPYIMEPFLCSMQRITYLNKYSEEFSEAALVKHLSIKLKEYFWSANFSTFNLNKKCILT